EYRLGAAQRHYLRRRRKGEGRAENRVPRTDLRRHQRQQQRVGTVGAGDGMLDADIFGDLLLEFRRFGMQNVATTVDDTIDRGLEPVPDPPPLCTKINELHVPVSSSPCEAGALNPRSV